MTDHPLVFKDLTVSLLYGFELRLGQESRHGTLPALKHPDPDSPVVWTPMYRLRKQAEYFARAVRVSDRLPKRVAIRMPSAWKRNAPDIKARLEASASFRREDGFGCFTLAFDAIEGERPFTTEDLLSILLSTPRTLDLGSSQDTTSECSQVFTVDEAERSIPLDRADALNGLSDAYLLYQSAMQDLVRGGFADPVVWHDNEDGGLYGGPPTTDPQIPYAFIEAVVSEDLYAMAFLEQRDNVDTVREARKRYSKDIAAVLARWLTPDNVPYASLDYWESRGHVKNGVFRNAYMNSLSFVAFSGLVTMMIRPENKQRLNPHPTEAKELPQGPAKHSILRCLEIARTRWHHSLYLNDALDRFIDDIIQTTSTKDILTHFSRLRDLKKSAATHLEDPFVYLWDATLGSQIAEFLRQSVMESIEKSVFNKLTLVKDILLDSLDEAKSRDIVKMLERKN